jgi:hypothetical protein
MATEKERVTKELDLTKKLSKIKNKTLRKEAANEVGQFLVDYILDKVGQAESPVEKGIYNPDLTKKYKKIKGNISGNLKANMELFGDMLDALEYTAKDGIIEVGIFDKDQAKKAYGHNTGFSGHPNSEMRGNKYKRQFIPSKSKNFNKEAREEINRIIDDYASEV